MCPATKHVRGNKIENVPIIFQKFSFILKDRKMLNISLTLCLWHHFLNDGKEVRSASSASYFQSFTAKSTPRFTLHQFNCCRVLCIRQALSLTDYGHNNGNLSADKQSDKLGQECRDKFLCFVSDLKAGTVSKFTSNSNKHKLMNAPTSVCLENYVARRHKIPNLFRASLSIRGVSCSQNWEVCQIALEPIVKASS